MRDELKNRRGLAIPEEIEVHRSDGTTYIMTPQPPRERYDPEKGYQYDELFDALPNADRYIPQPQPKGQRQPSYRAPRRERVHPLTHD